jgi:DNA-binding NarL/FixJ family response regulator
LFQTLGQAELFLLDGEISEDSLLAAGCERAAKNAPDLVVVDLDGLDDDGPDLLTWAARRWPAAPRLALDNSRDSLSRSPAMRRLGADCALARNAPAGDLLVAARRIIY